MKSNRLLCMTGWTLVTAAAGAVSADTRPNIVLILADDMGFSDIGCYGSEISTPNLDGLARNGIRMSEFYNNARCCPTRAALLPGLYPHNTGIGGMTGWHYPAKANEAGYQQSLNKQCVTIAQVLHTASYRTYALGKWHVADDMSVKGGERNWPLQRGFDKYYGTIDGAGSYVDVRGRLRQK